MHNIVLYFSRLEWESPALSMKSAKIISPYPSFYGSLTLLVWFILLLRQGTSRAGKVHLDENLMSSIVVRISLHMLDEVAADEQHKTLVGESVWAHEGTGAACGFGCLFA